MYALFGMSFPISKILLQYTTPILFTAIRMVIAGLLLLLYQLSYTKHKFRFQKAHAWMYVQVIFFGVYVTYILRFWGLAQLSAGKTAFLFNMAPFFTAFYAYFMEKERLSRMQWVGLMIGFIGVVPMIILTSTTEKSFGEFFIFSWAEIAVLAAVATHSYSWMIMRRLIRKEHYPPTLINGICMTIGGSSALFTSLLVEEPKPIVDIGYFISWLLVVILVSNIISHNLYGYLLKFYSPTFLSFTGFLGPLFAALYGWFFLHEKISWHFGVSMTLVLLGLFFFYRHELSAGGIRAHDGE
jgi:drug/metabolite transporter (DMT)-like permease